jgi:hypothetical protein
VTSANVLGNTGVNVSTSIGGGDFIAGGWFAQAASLFCRFFCCYLNRRLNFALAK